MPQLYPIRTPLPPHACLPLGVIVTTAWRGCYTRLNPLDPCPAVCAQLLQGDHVYYFRRVGVHDWELRRVSNGGVIELLATLHDTNRDHSALPAYEGYAYPSRARLNPALTASW